MSEEEKASEKEEEKEEEIDDAIYGKRPRLDADTCVIIGDSVFHVDSHHFRSISHYFDGAFRSQMKEAKERRFVFADKDPKEWELLMSICAPFPSTPIDSKNVEVILRWCDALQITAGMQACDKVIAKSVKGLDLDKLDESDKLFAIWKLASTMVLPMTKQKALAIMKKGIADSPGSLLVEEWKQVQIRIRQDKENKEALWEPIAKHIPDVVAIENTVEELLENNLFPYLMHHSTSHKAE